MQEKLEKVQTFKKRVKGLLQPIAQKVMMMQQPLMQ